MQVHVHSCTAKHVWLLAYTAWMIAQRLSVPHSPLCGLPQTFKQRLHNSYSYVINAAADYMLLRPLVRNAWCAPHALNVAWDLLLDCP